jgi:hypothetical protein
MSRLIPSVGPLEQPVVLMPGQDLGLPDAHGAGQAGQFDDLDTIAPAIEAIQGSAAARPPAA